MRHEEGGRGAGDRGAPGSEQSQSVKPIDWRLRLKPRGQLHKRPPRRAMSRFVQYSVPGSPDPFPGTVFFIPDRFLMVLGPGKGPQGPKIAKHLPL